MRACAQLFGLKHSHKVTWGREALRRGVVYRPPSLASLRPGAALLTDPPRCGRNIPDRRTPGLP